MTGPTMPSTATDGMSSDSCMLKPAHRTLRLRSEDTIYLEPLSLNHALRGTFLHVRRADACRHSVWEIGARQLVMQGVRG